MTYNPKLSTTPSNGNSSGHSTGKIRNEHKRDQFEFIFGTFWSLDCFCSLVSPSPFAVSPIQRLIPDSTQKDKTVQTQLHHLTILRVTSFCILPSLSSLHWGSHINFSARFTHTFTSTYANTSIKLTVMLITHRELSPYLSICNSWALELNFSPKVFRHLCSLIILGSIQIDVNLHIFTKSMLQPAATVTLLVEKVYDFFQNCKASQLPGAFVYLRKAKLDWSIERSAASHLTHVLMYLQSKLSVTPGSSVSLQPWRITH